MEKKILLRVVVLILAGLILSAVCLDFSQTELSRVVTKVFIIVWMSVLCIGTGFFLHTLCFPMTRRGLPYGKLDRILVKILATAIYYEGIALALQAIPTIFTFTQGRGVTVPTYCYLVAVPLSYAMTERMHRLIQKMRMTH